MIILVYAEIAKQLIYGKKPSRFLQSLLEHGVLSVYPLDMLSRLKKVEQSKEHHPEGNVWNHTLLVIDEAAKVREQSDNPEAFMWAALLHDLGKAVTTKRRNGKITAYNHEKAGADLARKFLGCFTDRLDFIERVAALVRWHMQLLFVTKGLPFADIKAMKQEADLHDIALLGLCDRLGRKGADEIKEKKNVLAFLEAIAGPKPIR